MKADAKSKLITDYTVTAANVHDSQELFNLLDESCAGENLFADSAYASSEGAKALNKEI